MRAVDLDEKVIATFYSEEYEEWTRQTTTIEDVLDSVCDDYTVLSSAHLSLDEWCTDCKEYDNEKNCCPRFNKVIREALKEGLAESTDAISRNAAIDIIQSYKKNTERLKEISVEDVVDMFEDLIDDIRNESSVQPMRKKGTWEKDELFGEDAYVCTYCETIWKTGQIKNMHFCPTCGSDMRGSSV